MGLRSEHAAPTDVELARRRRGIDIDLELDAKDESESDPAPGSVEQRAVTAVRAMTDGGEVVDPDTVREWDGQQRALRANEIACDLAEIDGVQDFEPFCALIIEIQDDIIHAWNEEEHRETASASTRQLVVG